MIKLQENKNKRNETMSNDRKKYLKRIKKTLQMYYNGGINGRKYTEAQRWK